MIVPSDIEYEQTKLLKKGQGSLPSPFKELAAWIDGQYGVCVLNVCYDTVIPDDRPRLQVVLERNKDLQKFRRGQLGNYNPAEQKRVREKFEELLVEQGDQGTNVDGLFVVFSAFESVARIEANSKVPEEEISRLKRSLGNKDLWKISRCFAGVTFIIYTDQQAEAHDAEGLRASYAEEYLAILKPHDEFGYLTTDSFSVNFDSKENFDTNYHGNWGLYYR